MNADKAAWEHFDALSRDEKTQAICRMTDTGYSDYAIATATRFSIEMVREILAERVLPVAATGTIAHAHAMTEQALEAIDPKWRTR